MVASTVTPSRTDPIVPNSRPTSQVAAPHDERSFSVISGGADVVKSKS